MRNATTAKSDAIQRRLDFIDGEIDQALFYGRTEVDIYGVSEPVLKWLKSYGYKTSGDSKHLVIKWD